MAIGRLGAAKALPSHTMIKGPSLLYMVYPCRMLYNVKSIL